MIKKNPDTVSEDKAMYESTQPVFTKSKVISLKRYAGRRDLLHALLKDGENYTLEQVDGLIRQFMKGKVK